MTASKNCEGNNKCEKMDDLSDMCTTLQNLEIHKAQDQSPTSVTELPNVCEYCDSGLGEEINEKECKQGKGALMSDEIGQNQLNPDIAEGKMNSEAFFRCDEDGDTFLHISILLGDESKIFKIIQMATDILELNIANKLYQTALHLAVLTRQSRVVRRLICAGTGVDAQDHNGNTPLHLACALGYYDIAEQLLKPVTYEETLQNQYIIPFQRIPQNMNLRNYHGSTCLHLAVANKRLGVISLLLAAGADSNFGQGKSGRSAVHLAAEIGNLEILVLLIHNSQVDFERMDYGGLTPFQLAQGRGNYGVMSFLIHLGIPAVVTNPEDDSDVDLGT